LYAVGLFDHIEDEDECRVSELEDGAETKRAAILTIATQGHENLMQSAEAIFLDGTAVRNSPEWTKIPITLAGDGREVVSGGVPFHTSE
jgi:hypothetical protein